VKIGERVRKREVLGEDKKGKKEEGRVVKVVRIEGGDRYSVSLRKANPRGSLNTTCSPIRKTLREGRVRRMVYNCSLNCNDKNK